MSGRRPFCVDCGTAFSRRRAATGATTCIACGDRHAQTERQAKAKAAVPMHKSNYVYAGRGDTAKQMVKDIAAMRRTY